ncbi:regulatory protein RecX [Coprobacter sp.]
MSKPLSSQEALHKAAAYCSSSEQCRYDITEKLRRWGVENEDVLKIIEHLVQQNFIDEARYSKGFVNDKFRFNKWGRIKIIHALRQKKIPENLISEAINTIDKDQYVKTLREILETKCKGMKATDNYDMQAKLFRFAVSRGFEPDIIQIVFHNMKPS